jgi:glycosyltransferase involved in cell wall biosynthesis
LTPVRASVCMASYNGSAFIREQIESILADIGMDDELVVVDDASPDDTPDIVAGITDPRVRLVRSPENRRYVRTFNAAAEMAQGEYIFFADQDDVWIPGRTEHLIRSLQDRAVVAGNVALFGGPPDPAPWSLRSRDSSHRVRNLVGTLVGYRPYYGCAMGFRRDFAQVVLPMPGYLYESHDLWLSIAGNLAGEMNHVESPAVLYRRLHDANETPRGWRGPRQIVSARIMLIRCVITASARLRSRRRADGGR